MKTAQDNVGSPAWWQRFAIRCDTCVAGFRPIPDFVSDLMVLKEITIRGAYGNEK